MPDYLNSVLSWLKGDPAPAAFTPAPPLVNYPTTMDADYARKYGFGYGSGNEPYLDNQQARIVGDVLKGEKFEPRGLTSYDRKDVTNPDISKTVPLTGDARGALDNTYMRAALAANRSPIASIGFNPDNFGMDVKSGPLTMGGGYNRKTDMGFSTIAPDDSLVHESTHRGMQKLREKYPEEVNKAMSSGYMPSEEMIVRYLMQTQAGNPEGVSGRVIQGITGSSQDLIQQNNAQEQFKSPTFGRDRQKALNELQELAIRYRKDMHPGGPR